MKSSGVIPTLKRLWAPTGALILGVLISELVLYEARLVQGDRLWRSVLDEANEVRALLESRINAATAKANGVAIYVTAVEGDIQADDLESVLRQVYESGDYFRNIGLAPDNRIEYLYPLAGNEAALGLDYRSLPEQWPVIQSMIEQRQGRLAGPLPLVQGGTALLYREPIYINDAYWGLLSTVINSDDLLSTIDSLANNNGIDVALRGADALGAEGAVFRGSVITFDQADAVLDIFVPGGSWQMAIRQTAAPIPLSPIQRVSIWLATALLLGLLLLSVRVPFHQMVVSRLERAVDERTDRLARANGLLASVLDSARNFAIIATDRDGTITLFNQGAEAMLGYRADEVIGRSTPVRFFSRSEVTENAAQKDHPSGTESDLFRALVADLRPGDTDIGEWTYQRKNGTTLPVWLVLSDITDDQGEAQGYLSIATDLTEQRQNEQLKSEFIATVSHELRTPVTALLGAVGLLRGSYGDQLPDEALSLITLAERNGGRLKALIQDLLDIQQMELGRLALNSERVPLGEQVNAAVELVLSLAQEKSITIAVPAADPARVVAVDVHRFQQVLGNLLSNAIKFSPEQSTISIEFGSSERMAEVRILDEGPGIPEAFVPRLFQKFSQVDSGTTRSTGGTGLGLAISQELMRRMGGWIDYESAPDGGALFSVSVPLVSPVSE